MALIKFATFFSIILVVSFAQEHHDTAGHEEEHHSHPKYEFKYGVKDEHTHDIKEQHEKSDGHKVTGYYKLLEADGTTRTVHYTADKHTGFHAQVQRSGHAVHPTHHKEIQSNHHHEAEDATAEFTYHEPTYILLSNGEDHQV